MSSQGVYVSLNFVQDNSPGAARFPSVGDCTALWSDAVPVFGTCLTSITVDGNPLSNDAPQAGANPYQWRGALSHDSTLRIEDCGHVVEVPLRAGPYRTASDVTATPDGNDLVVAWNDGGAASIGVSSVADFAQTMCHVTGEATHRFAGLGAADHGSVQVQAFDAPVTTTTDVGDVTVWYGDIVDIAAPYSTP